MPLKSFHQALDSFLQKFQEEYKSLYEVMSPDEEQVPPFEKYPETRWLVRGKLIFRVLMNWKELQAYFTVAQPART